MDWELLRRLNKIDSQKYRNLQIPERNIYINEAHELFIKWIAHPRYKPVGFEFEQRSIEDIRTIVVNSTTPIAGTEYASDSYSFPLPDDYMYHVSSFVDCTKGGCERRIRTYLARHDELFQESEFVKSSFEWEEINILFGDYGIRAFHDGTFEITGLYLDYIRRPKYVHNAGDYINGTYDLFGTVLTGTQDSELPEETHNEIVDIAAMIATGDLQTNYQMKAAKVALNQT